MKKITLLLLFMCFSVAIHAQSIIGAWETSSTSENGAQLRTVIIFADGYYALTNYNASTGAFVSTTGGSWTLQGDKMTQIVEFDTKTPERVGTELTSQVVVTDDQVEMVDSSVKFKRIDNGSPGSLQGAWLMSGRVRNGETQLRDISGPRKTMKILSGTRFQWIAYNTETKQFMGTGGGTYTTENGEYTENIEFFSRDDAKAGLSLTFNYSLIEGTWHHKGLSSKGDPIHEIWSVR